MPEKPPDPSKPALPDTIPAHAYRELMKFVKACGDFDRAYEIAKLLNTMTISASELLEGLEAVRKH